MFFNSFEYAIFLPIIFIIYWLILNKNLKLQNLFLLISSYFFYSCWDWKFLFLLAFSTILDYISGLKIYNSNTQIKKKIWLIISVSINLGFLGFFKYYNFFIESFADLIQKLGFTAHYSTLNIILPVGISFYTFHGLSYVFDIYNKKIKPSHNWIEYALFVSFFPLLVAGPIERATHLLPQIEKPRKFNYELAVSGLKQILWGLFKKIVIADNCAKAVNLIFNSYESQSGGTLFLGAILFSFQIYGDFSGYSDIALGSGKLLGIKLIKNFNYPYFSRSIAEFWRRWHISLSSWFKDYLYIPLGGSKGGTIKRIRNTFIIFLVSGFWHGANWTFILWGGLNALFILPSIIFKTNRNNMDIVAKGKILPNFKEFFQIVYTFLLASFAWIFFRSESLSQAFSYINKMFNSIHLPDLSIFNLSLFPLLLLLILVEWKGRENNYAIEKLFYKSKTCIRWSFYYILIILMLVFGQKNSQEFIYFQF
ncbi:MBOAT family protein [Apibacter sp. B3889]|uniref:MBOAT family O-acyltransferase n=1 Tax=unclassified Apibacter TaxID=2630820 RepID=UPI001327648F|nr:MULTISPECIES: MBOAT family O-acyltransferase [unclassified Apibacter]MXO33457.1 MBOAT family protein [Apibacter sp. B3883]MXO40814.1 MBOAT family protein [Apibacter sp. B3889]MXP03983.1 MBOAT family protein [Apibacter sp. B3887]MXP07206.1 MBOAT family protein [Apibacter sp. B3935]